MEIKEAIKILDDVIPPPDHFTVDLAHLRICQAWEVVKIELKEVINGLSSATPTLYGYQIEHLEMIARVMAKENYTPEAVVQILQNAGEIARMVREEMMEMLKESVERACKGEER